MESTPPGTYLGIDIGSYDTTVTICHNGKIMIPESMGVLHRQNVIAVPNKTKKIEQYDAHHDDMYCSRYEHYVQLIGRDFDDPIVAATYPYLGFPVTYFMDERNRKRVALRHKQNEQHEHDYVPFGFLLQTHLSGLIEWVKKYTPGPITEVVIVVSATYTQLQRKEILKAATNAGLTMKKRLVSTSLATAAHLWAEEEFNKHILYVDVGAVKSEVAMIHTTETSITTTAVTGDSFFGGDDICRRLLQMFAKKVYEQYGLDICPVHKYAGWLNVEADRIKYNIYGERDLEQTMRIRECPGQEHVHATIRQDDTLVDTKDIHQKLDQMIQKTVRASNATWKDIGYLYLKDQMYTNSIVKRLDIIKDKQPPRQYPKDLHEDKMSRGAAWICYLESDENTKKITISELANRNVYIKVAKGERTKLISATMILPVTVTKTFVLMSPTTKVNVEIYESVNDIREEDLILPSETEELPIKKTETEIEVICTMTVSGIYHMKYNTKTTSDGHKRRRLDTTN